MDSSGAATVCFKTLTAPSGEDCFVEANLTSDKKEDGIAKLLVKGDVARVAGKSKEQKCGEAEAALSDAMQINDSVIDAGNAKEEDLLKALGSSL